MGHRGLRSVKRSTVRCNTSSDLQQRKLRPRAERKGCRVEYRKLGFVAYSVLLHMVYQELLTGVPKSSTCGV